MERSSLIREKPEIKRIRFLYFLNKPLLLGDPESSQKVQSDYFLLTIPIISCPFRKSSMLFI